MMRRHLLVMARHFAAANGTDSDSLRLKTDCYAIVQPKPVTQDTELDVQKSLWVFNKFEVLRMHSPWSSHKQR